jgi:hypothetical protein
MKTATLEPGAKGARNTIQARVDQILRFGRTDRRAEREVAYGDHLKVLLEDIRSSSGRSDSRFG